MFTRQTLRRLANDNSYRRGEDYYDEGQVEKLRREGAGFAATVRGSRPYRVALHRGPAGPEFSCNCPYAFDGICKHKVALGLAVLDAYGAELDIPNPASAAAPPVADRALATAIKAAWADRRKGDKLRFLKQALAKNDDLARQFLGFGQPAAAPADPLANLPARLTDTLGVLDFDEDFWENSESFYEDDEGDGLQEAADELLRDTLAPFAAELLHLARGGQFVPALRYWATACEALYQLEEPASDDFGLFGDYGEDVLHQWHAVLAAAGWPAALLAAVLPPAELAAGIAWLGAHLADPPARWPGFEASWQPLLLALAADAAAAPLLPPLLAQAALGPAAEGPLRLRLAQTLADDVAWAETAETLLLTDAAVAQQLLHFYTSQANRPALLRTAATAFATWPDQFGDYVLRTFSSATAPALYRDALRHRAQANHSLPDYALLRPLLSAAEAAAFVQAAVAAAQDRRGSVAFAAQLLAQTGDVAALREFVLGLEWLAVSPPYHTEIAMMALADTDPLPLMLELEIRTRAYLHGRANAKRGAFLYERIGRWLVSLRGTAPRLAEPILRLAQELREEFPTLHGLRDVLRAEGFLPNEPATATGSKARGRRPKQ
ncbi:SWIM zinc finger family protein [Hymenobacter sp. PAMC 26628]|uniref:SWIM zinc finger family protein n=1 Tax=Hymenobacter sp. PAMC 26628 TaxID=1484118 RepID=UPI00076FF2C5|nr:hypothetical protein [Hymenobacter sp. PAMC 26628]AMJ67018.1 hypothetical protein AXW84_17445 [Hymenobacter sp. PAMC 26628]